MVSNTEINCQKELRFTNDYDKADGSEIVAVLEMPPVTLPSVMSD
jgi:hypothetical protein